MKETFLPSSANVAVVEYDSADQTLTVEFKNGGKYIHRNVPQSDFMAFQNARSAGSFYHSRIKGRYVTERIE